MNNLNPYQTFVTKSHRRYWIRRAGNSLNALRYEKEAVIAFMLDNGFDSDDYEINTYADALDYARCNLDIFRTMQKDNGH
jgi:hypothetical protein